MTAQPASSASRTMPGDPNAHWLALTVQRTLSPAGPSPFSLVQRACAEQDRTGATGFAACALGADPQSAGAARKFTSTTLGNWNLAAHVDSVAVIVSEMVSNALRYGVPAPHGRSPARQPVWLGLLRQGKTVLCAVFDPGMDVPVVREPDYLAETGRGLHLIDSLSDAWGWTQPDSAGKAVWAMLSAPAAGTRRASLA